MIRTCFGTIVRDVVANCGRHTPLGCQADVSCTLLLVELADPLNMDQLSWSAYRFAESLRADGGWSEIEQAVKIAQRYELPAGQLQQALEDAQ